MLKYLAVAFLLSGALALEVRISTLDFIGPAVPETGLLLLMVYACRGQGKILASLCFLLGWLEGLSRSEPAGYYILAYLIIGVLLNKLRGLFFLERPLTQLALCSVHGFLYWLIHAASRGTGLMPPAPSGLLEQSLFGALSAGLLAPVACYFYDRSTNVRKRLHP